MNTNETFLRRIKNFWEWFPGQADQITQALDAGAGADELNTTMDKLSDLMGLPFVFSRQFDDSGYALTLTGEGDLARQLLCQSWLEHEVAVPGWAFFASKQPTPSEFLSDLAIELGEYTVDFESLLFQAVPDEESETVDITAWHPAFENMDEDARFQILYLLLDEALGEFATQSQLGEIAFAPLKSGPDVLPLFQLPQVLKHVWKENEWTDFSPLTSFVTYQVEPTEGFSRSDTLAGHTCLPLTIGDYFDSQGKPSENPFDEFGAELNYIELIGCGVEAVEDPLERRESVENQLTEWINQGAGKIVGGAIGSNHAYIDLVMLDGERSRTSLTNCLAELQPPIEYRVLPFFDE